MTEAIRSDAGPCGDRSRDLAEELLELVWTLRESKAPGIRRDRPESALEDESLHGQDQECLHSGMGEAVGRAEELGWIEPGKETLTFTAAGEEHARRLVRRHRLARVLLHAVLELRDEHASEQACKLEHLLSGEVTDSVCAFLGHPRTCHHGRPIPPGACCERPDAEMEPLVAPLAKFPVGIDARVVFVSSRRHALVDRLASLGVIPGVVLRLHQRRPGFVLSVGETTLAIDAEVATAIWVRRLGESNG